MTRFPAYLYIVVHSMICSVVCSRFSTVSRTLVNPQRVSHGVSYRQVILVLCFPCGAPYGLADVVYGEYHDTSENDWDSFS